MTLRMTAAIAALGTILLPAALSAQSPEYGGTLRVGMARDAVGVEPHAAHGASVYMIQQNVYDNLIGYKPPDAEFEPELATTWEAVDPTTFRFTLRQGVVFHDGDSFDAEDAKFSIDRMRDPNSGASLAPQLADISEVKVTGPYEIEIKLSRPNAVIVSLLASTTAHMVSKQWFEAGNDPTKDMNGTGPFKFASFEPGVNTTLERNDNYWKKGMPYLDRVIAVPYRDDSARTNALLSGEVQFIEYVPWVDFTQFATSPDFRLHKGFTPFNIVRFGVTEKPFDDVRVRQAMNYLIDREELIALAFGGEGIPIKAGLIFPGTPYYSPDLERWSHDPDKALALLQEAGYSEFSDLSFTLKCATVTVHTDSAEAIQSMLRAFGMKVEIEFIDIPTLLEHRKSGGYQALMDGLSLVYFDPDAYANFFQTGATGHAAGAGFSDVELDRLLAEGRAETDFEKRRAIYRAFEDRLLELAPWYFGFFRPQGEAMEANVMGYDRLPGDLGSTTTSRFEYLWIDH